jgi:hypothetical protein
MKEPKVGFFVHMTISPEWYHWLKEFFFAVSSGGVAGLVAGWVLLRMQNKSQLLLEDEPKITSMILALEQARANLNGRVTWKEVMKNEPDFDEAKEVEAIAEAIKAAHETVFELRVKGESLRSRRFFELRVYLSLRILRDDIWFSTDSTEVLASLKEYLRDIDGYLRRPNFVMRFAHWVRDLPFYAKNHLSNIQKELLRAVVSQDMNLTLMDGPPPYILSLSQSLRKAQRDKET